MKKWFFGLEWIKAIPMFLSGIIITIITIVSGRNEIFLPLLFGLIASGIMDNDSAFHSRIIQYFIAIVFFSISILISVVFLSSSWILLSIVFSVMSFIWTMLGIFNTKLKSITTATILVGFYAIFLYSTHKDHIYIIHLSFYMVLSTAIYGSLIALNHFIYPSLNVKRSLVNVYNNLGNFLSEKSNLFDPDENINIENNTSYSYRRNELNIELSEAKRALANRVPSKLRSINRFLRFYYVAENILQRLDVDYIDYNSLKNKFKNNDILFRIQRLIEQLGSICKDISFDIQNDNKILINNKIKVRLEILEESIKEISNYHYVDDIQFILSNIRACIWQLQHLDDDGEDALDTFESIDLREKLKSNSSFLKAKIIFSPKYYFNKLISNLTYKSESFRHAIRISIAILVGMFTYYVVDEIFVFWTLVAILFVIQPNYYTTKNRVVGRIFGNIVGSICGSALLLMNQDAYSSVFMFLTAFAMIFMLLFRLHNYGFSTMFLTISIFLAMDASGFLLNLEILFLRTTSNIVGSILSLLAILYIWPDWKFFNVHHIINTCYRNNYKLIMALSGFIMDKVDKKRIDKYRLLALDSNAKLTSTIYNISKIKEHYKRYISLSDKFVSLNDVILSYIQSICLLEYDNRIIGSDLNKDLLTMAILLKNIDTVSNDSYNEQLEKIHNKYFKMQIDKKHNSKNPIIARKLINGSKDLSELSEKDKQAIVIFVQRMSLLAKSLINYRRCYLLIKSLDNK